jgi:hypothetical protein
LYRGAVIISLKKKEIFNNNNFKERNRIRMKEKMIKKKRRDLERAEIIIGYKQKSL